MPTYHYECSDCGETVERVCTISEMLEFQSLQQFHWPTDNPASCAGTLIRSLKMRKSPVFRAGYFEHVGPDGTHAASAQQLAEACAQTGNTSQYIADMGSMFGAKVRKEI
jgi:hypothetical protein